MADVELGQIIKISTVKRDAVHVAVMPLFADAELKPGQRITIDDPQQYAIPAFAGDDGDAIVDPFLMREVHPGERFWAFMLPGSVHNLRHNWTHPKLTDDDEPLEEDWRAECRGCD